MERSLIIGMGEIGMAVHGVVGTSQTLDLDKKDIELPIDILHICFPYSDKFADQVNYYAGIYKPNHIIIYSTLPIGTTRKILGAVHSPVEGRHPDLELSIRTMPRWIGTNDQAEGRFFYGFFAKRNLKVKIVNDSNFTEMLKIRSTAKYGINLLWASYEQSIADDLNMPYVLVKDFDKDYNRLYRDLGQDWAQRYILDPPEGKIGGHCVVPNAKLLNEQYPNKWLEELSEC